MRRDIFEIQEQWVHSFKKGDKQAFYHLYKAYVKAMYNTALRILNQKEEAEDVVQEAFVEAYEKIHKLKNERSFPYWLKQIVIHKALNRINKVERRILSDDLSQIQPERETEYKEEDWEKYTVNDIKKAVQELSTSYRLVFTLYAFEDLSHKEIAEKMNITVSTSKSQYNRAKSRLRKILNSSRK